MSLSAASQAPETRFDQQGAPARVLVVDDDEALRNALSRVIAGAGAEVTAVSNALEALAHLELAPVDVVLTDVYMPQVDGLELVGEIKRRFPEVEVVVMSGAAGVDGAVKALQRGAFHYLTKPIADLDAMVVLLLRAVERRKLRSRASLAPGGMAGDDMGLLGTSPAMVALRDLIRTIAPAPLPVLITGESGVGKERVAKAIHALSDRRERPMVSVNCAALPEALLESELFGHEKGAFTGAHTSRVGLFEAADHGTLLLDEIGDMSLALQAKLLRVLQEGEVRRLGANTTTRIDVRVIAATNVDLEAARRERRFRDDLFYRLDVVSVAVPPLRARISDLPILAHHFVAAAAARLKKPTPAIADDALAAMQRHSWPGNVRELASALERATLLAGSTIEARHLPEAIVSSEQLALPRSLARLTYAEAKKAVVEAFERRYVELVLAEANANISEAARHAGMDRANFKRLVRRLGLDAHDVGDADD